MLKTDAEILDWLERHYTLHTRVTALYVVDGYEVRTETERRGGVLVSAPCKGETLREAYSKMMAIVP